jgi:hypothetical protein
MRKSFWFSLTVLLVAISAPTAYADTFTYSYSSGELGCGTTGNCAVYSWTTAAIAAVASETTISAADLTASLLSGTPLAGCVLSSVTLDFGGTGGQSFTSSNCGGRSNPDAFSLADYSTPGIYSFVSVNAGVNDSLVVTAVQTPEPSTVALMLLGLGLAFVIRRKREGVGHLQAT